MTEKLREMAATGLAWFCIMCFACVVIGGCLALYQIRLLIDRDSKMNKQI